MTDEKPTRQGWLLAGSEVPSPRLPPGLHIVATPIGNLGDITIRALHVLAAADIVLAEDTRVAARLLEHYGIRTRARRFDAHASPAQRAAVIESIAGGSAVALISDAGTPLLSDPGAELVREALAAGVVVQGIPGPSALLAALVVAGLPADVFTFAGFLPAKTGDRKRRLRQFAELQTTLVFYEAPHRIAETLIDMRAVLGDRRAAAARELTKLHEEVVRGSLSEISTHFTAHEPRGEFVVMVEPAGEDAGAGDVDIDARLTEAMQSLSVKDAAAAVAGELGLVRREVYARALRLNGKS
jgi:16S rRNA (cytidine1402-2'-O)-methyltransferase